jgi:hypothetical protein
MYCPPRLLGLSQKQDLLAQQFSDVFAQDLAQEKSIVLQNSAM